MQSNSSLTTEMNKSISEEEHGDSHSTDFYDNSDQMKRYRTNYSRNQINRLEQEFRREKYLSRLKRTELAKELGLKESTIKVWFQNRRMKEKRQLTTINIPQVLANSDPFLYSYLLDSARAYYNFTSQFGGSHVQQPTKLDTISTETALAAFMSTNKLIPCHNSSSTMPLMPMLKPFCSVDCTQIMIPPSATPRCCGSGQDSEMSTTFGSTHADHSKPFGVQSTKKSEITFRPYMDS